MENTDAVAALGGLAQETRLAIFRRLVEVRPRGLPAGEIGSALNLAATTLSFHLKEMKQAGLVTSERNGRSIVYTANMDTIDELMAFLNENCCSSSDLGQGPEVARKSMPTNS